MSAKSLIISSDSHVVEPPQLWSDRMDATHGERIPHLEVGDPHDQWYCDGEVVGTLGRRVFRWNALLQARGHHPGRQLR